MPRETIKSQTYCMCYNLWYSTCNTHPVQIFKMLHAEPVEQPHNSSANKKSHMTIGLFKVLMNFSDTYDGNQFWQTILVS